MKQIILSHITPTKINIADVFRDSNSYPIYGMEACKGKYIAVPHSDTNTIAWSNGRYYWSSAKTIVELIQKALADDLKVFMFESIFEVGEWMTEP